MANHGQQLCLAKPRGEPCAKPRQTQHPCMPELPNCICFDCCEWLLVRWVSALLAAAAVPLLPAGGVWRKFKVPGDFQYPPAGSVLCAFCTQPAHGDEPLLKCCGLRDGNTCKLAWHLPCHEAVSGTAGPPQDDVFQCCTGWPARAAIDPKDRFCQPTTFYRKGLARPGRLPPQAHEPQPSPRKGMGWLVALFFILSGVVTIASAPTIAPTAVEHLRSAASSFDLPAPMASTNHSASGNVFAFLRLALQKITFQEPAANNTTPNFLYKVKDLLFDLHDDALEAEEVEEMEEVEGIISGGEDGGVGGGGDQGGSEGAGGYGGGVDGDSGGGGGGEGGTAAFLLHSAAASTYGAMVFNAFAPTVFPVVRATFLNAGQYFAFLRNRGRDAAIVAAASALGTAATAIDTEEPDWLVVAGQILGPQE